MSKKFSRQHYQHIGEAIRNQPDLSFPMSRESLASFLAGIFWADNPNFVPSEFMRSIRQPRKQPEQI